MRKSFRKPLLAFALAVCALFSLCATAQAASIMEGSKTCTVALAPVHDYLTTTAGTSLRAGGYNYTTNDGLTGPRTLDLSDANRTLSQVVRKAGPCMGMRTIRGVYSVTRPIHNETDH